MKYFLYLSLLNFVFLLGCMKTPDTKINYGVESTREEVNSAISSAAGTIDARKGLKGEFVHLQGLQSIRGGPTSVVAELGKTIAEREENDKLISLTIIDELIEYKGNNKQERKQTQHLMIVDKATGAYAIPFAKNPEFSAQLALLNPFDTNGVSYHSNNKLAYYDKLFLIPSEAQFKPYSKVTTFTDEPVITYHNLKVKDTLETPPDLVKQDPACQGIPDCQLHTKEVQFDQVTWKTSTEGEKETVWIKVSPDVPLLAQPHEFCRQFSYPIEKQRIIVTFCNKVINFNFGQK